MLLILFKSIMHQIFSQNLHGIPRVHVGTNFQMPDQGPAPVGDLLSTTKHNATAVNIHIGASKTKVMSAFTHLKRRQAKQ